MDPTKSESDARLKLNEAGKRNQLLRRVKHGGILAKVTLIGYLAGVCLMVQFLWGVFKAHQSMLLGMMTFFAYVLAFMAGSCASNDSNQRINDLIELIGEDKLLHGKE